MSGIAKVLDVTKSMPPVTFQSRLGLEVVAQLVALPIFFGSVSLVLILLNHHTRPLGFVVAAVGAILSSLFVLLTFPRGYVLTADSLLIRHGVFRDRVSLARIRSAVLSGDPNRDRLRKVRLTLDTGRRLLNPQHRGEFIRVLKERAHL